MPLTDNDRNIQMVIINMDRTIKDLMNQRDALAAMLPNKKKVRSVGFISLADLRKSRRHHE